MNQSAANEVSQALGRAENRFNDVFEDPGARGRFKEGMSIAQRIYREAMRELTSSPTVTVTFEWDPSFGTCYDCGNPAAYQALAMYGPDHTPGPEDLFCSVCTAQHAVVDGETFRYLFAEPEEAQS